MPTTTLSFVPGRAGRLRVEESGSGRTPVLLVHGNGGDRTHFSKTLPHLAEVSIGHALISRALFVGLDRAVRDYVTAVSGACFSCASDVPGMASWSRSTAVRTIGLKAAVLVAR